MFEGAPHSVSHTSVVYLFIFPSINLFRSKQNGQAHDSTESIPETGKKLRSNSRHCNKGDSLSAHANMNLAIPQFFFEDAEVAISVDSDLQSFRFVRNPC